MKCEKIQELILMDYLDGEMGAEQLEQVEKHLTACAHCREFETMAKQTVFEPFMNVERVSSPESVWYQIKKTIEVKGEEAVVASFFENLRALFSVKRPVLALSIITSETPLPRLRLMRKCFVFPAWKNRSGSKQFIRLRSSTRWRSDITRRFDSSSSGLFWS